MTQDPFADRIAMPPPEELFREAEEEPNYRDLSHYADTIRILRDKGFSYRDIAEWMSERGVPVDHNAVYRVFTNSLSDYDAHLESERVDQEAQEEGDRNS
jgi:transposase-like protein